MDLTYRLINVFAASDDPFSGNAICIFEDGSKLSDEQMHHLAQQMNLETVFILGSSATEATIRLFTPAGEGRFAGSASLGTAHVVNAVHGDQRQAMVLMAEGRGQTTNVSPVGKDDWQIRVRKAEARPLKSTPQILASLVGLPLDAIHGQAMVIDSGRSGIVLPVRTVEDVHKTRLDARLLHSYAMLLNTEPQVYVWSEMDSQTIVSRMFFGPGGGVLEVAATGSGAANLGHWLAAHGHVGIQRRIEQGAALGRPSRIGLTVQEDAEVLVSGHVNMVAEGTFRL